MIPIRIYNSPAKVVCSVTLKSALIADEVSTFRKDHPHLEFPAIIGQREFFSSVEGACSELSRVGNWSDGNPDAGGEAYDIGTGRHLRGWQQSL